MRRGWTGVLTAAAVTLALLSGCTSGGLDRGDVAQLLRDQGAPEDVPDGLVDDAVTLIEAMCASDKPVTESVLGINEVLDEGLPLRFVTNAVHKFCPDRQSALDLVNIARQ